MSEHRYIYIERLLVVFLAILFGYHLYIIFQTAVNAPFSDEWNLIRGFPNRFSLLWLFEPNNQHLEVPTKIQIWLSYIASGWDFRQLQLLNYILFAASLCLLYILIRKTQGLKNAIAALPLFPTAFSFINWENELWGFQSALPIFVSLLVLGCYFLFKGKYTFYLGAIFLFSAVISFGTGVATLAAIIVIYFLANRPQLDKTRLLVLISALLIPLTLILVLKDPALESIYTSPLSYRYWEFVFNMISFSFGFQTFSIWLGIFSAFLLLYPSTYFFLALLKGRDVPLFLLSVSLSVFAAILLISLGRANNPLFWSKSLRYLPILWLLLPFGVMLWFELLAQRQKIKYLVASLFIIFANFGYADDWSTSTFYWTKNNRISGLDCVCKFLQNTSEHDVDNYSCPQLHFAPLGSSAIKAKELGLSFLKHCSKQF